MKINFIKYKNVFFGISGTLVLLSILAVGFFGFKQGIDFAGGTLWQVKFDNQSVTENVIKDDFKSKFGINDVYVSREATTQSFLIRFKDITEEKHQEYLNTLRQDFGTVNDLSFQSIGPSIGSELRRNALIALGLAMLAISLYIAFAFRKVSYPVTSWKYGAATMLKLFHDIVIPAGLLAILGHYMGVEIDVNFIVALLLVMGFSVHDTIVVFDRIRENLILNRGKAEFDSVINHSLNQTLARSINTSLTLVIVLLALVFVGPASIFYFILMILVGILAGTYSSICIASPLLYVWHQAGKK